MGLVLELHYNNKSKGTGCIIGITIKKDALTKHALIILDKESLTYFLRQKCGLQENELKSTSYYLTDDFLFSRSQSKELEMKFLEKDGIIVSNLVSEDKAAVIFDFMVYTRMVYAKRLKSKTF